MGIKNRTKCMQKCAKKCKAKVKKLKIVFMVIFVFFDECFELAGFNYYSAFKILFLANLIINIIIGLKRFRPAVQNLFNSSSVTRLSLVLKQYGEMIKLLALFVEENTVLFWERAWLMGML